MWVLQQAPHLSRLLFRESNRLVDIVNLTHKPAPAAALQLINVCAWVFPNAILLRHTCQWFDPFVIWGAFVSWTCWNTIFLIMCIEAHNCAPWEKGRATSKAGALQVMLHPCLTQAIKPSSCNGMHRAPQNGCFGLGAFSSMIPAHVPVWCIAAELAKSSGSCLVAIH